MSHGRKYGEKDSHPIPLWNGVFEHYGRIGDALWEFAWCIDAVTAERDGMGVVLGGSPVKLGVIVKAINGRSKETVRRHLKRLANEKYIRIRRTPYGQVIEVFNSCKFGIWHWHKRSGEKPQFDVSLPREKPKFEPEKPKFEPEKHQIDVSKEDAAVTQHKDAAVRAAACPVWKETGIDPRGLPGPFRKHCEEHWRIRNGASLYAFMGSVLDAWQALGNTKYPPTWARRKAELTHSSAKQEPERPELEAIPWKK
jgi:hypothetical protein